MTHLFLFFGSISIPILLGSYPIIALLCFMALALSYCLPEKHWKKYILFWIVVASCGVTSEIVCIYFGVWSYANPDIFGVPFWLFGAWGNAGLFSLHIAKLVGIQK